jgi:uncharacterized OB-fold protein
VAAVITLERFFEQARRGVLTALRCQRCGQLAMPPQDCCGACRERAWTTVPLGGDGTITSFTVPDGPVRAGAAEAICAVALVRLDEGVSLLGRVVDIPVDRLRIGMTVRFQPLVEGDLTTVAFGPAVRTSEGASTAPR